MTNYKHYLKLAYVDYKLSLYRLKTGNILEDINL